MKKTLKIFLVSFTLSSFAIWAANELFFSVTPSKTDKVAIPEKNIALFFQKNENIFPAVKTKVVKEARLAAVVPVVQENTNDEDHTILFGIERNAARAISIASVEDVADIPLEYGAPQKHHKKLPAKQIAAKENTSLTQTAVSKKEEKLSAPQTIQPVVSAAKKEVENTQKDSQPNIQTLKVAATIKSEVSAAETDFIPFENSGTVTDDGKIEIVNTAPKSQIAMAGDQISVDTLAIEQKDTETLPQKREWQPMVLDDESPWVIAQANKYAKNSKAVEDYAAKNDVAEIENLLSPKKIEEADKEVKTAEMVKNILIPIPEDILNDKNLTPQLVSSKKTPSDMDFDRDEEEVETDREGGSTLLKSITSIFSSSSNDSDEEEEKTEPKKKKRKKGLFAAFSDEKTTTKILPAEMKLAFQPGRAEISGQTLRWIQAFANKAAEDPNIVLEIRIDKNSSYALQQRRLDLLHTILSSRGMDSEKINTVFTSREPNSFIIRTLRLSDTAHNKPVKTYQRKNATYQTW